MRVAAKRELPATGFEDMGAFSVREEVMGAKGLNFHEKGWRSAVAVTAPWVAPVEGCACVCARCVLHVPPTPRMSSTYLWVPGPVLIGAHCCPPRIAGHATCFALYQYFLVDMLLCPRNCIAAHCTGAGGHGHGRRPGPRGDHHARGAGGHGGAAGPGLQVRLYRRYPVGAGVCCTYL